MHIEESIVVVEKFFSEDLRKKLLTFIDLKAIEKLKVHGISKEGKDEKIRDVFGHTLEKNNSEDESYFDLIQKEINRAFTLYQSKFGFLYPRVVNQVDILKYNQGQHYTAHTDHDQRSPRTISIIVNLNKDYTGGELVFYDPRVWRKTKLKEIKKINMNEGTIVFFPSTFLFPHAILPVTSGTRYSIVVWLT